MGGRSAAQLSRIAILGIAAVLGACGGVQIAPTPALPKALVTVIPAKVGLVLPADMRNYVHTETRSGVEWKVLLGAGHQQFAKALLAAGFREVVEFSDLEAARAASGLQAVFEPRVDQFSFATARDTGGNYVAVTIRYRISVYTPDGALVDTFTLTGYGNAVAEGMSSGTPIEVASRTAMRDAAAKFLTQFPEQLIGKQLIKGEALVAAAVLPAGGGSTMAAIDVIEAVPVRERRRHAAVPAAPVAPPPGPSPTTG